MPAPRPEPLRSAASAWRESLPLWLGSRVAVALAALAGARLVTSTPGQPVPGFLQLWDRWDVGLFVKVARYGWYSPAYADQTAVDFPGLPLLLRAVHVVVPDWVAAGLVVSLIAGAAACAALWWLGASEGGPEVGRLAVVFLVVMPYAVFLFAGYSEGLFLACATGAWLLARQDRWLLATLLACGATATRVIGVPFAVALAVQYLAQQRAHRPWRRVLDRRAPLLVLPLLPVLAFVTYLHARSGSWTAYADAQQAGWHRGLAPPWVGWRTTWFNAFTARVDPGLAWFWRAELLAAALGLVLTVVLLTQRRWGEGAFVGGTTLLMTSSSYYASGVRAVLVWFPLYLLLARWAARRRWLTVALVSTGAPLMVVATVAFTAGRWLD